MTRKTNTGRPRLSRPLVLEAAVALADEDGLDGFSMRRLGQELGVVPMALYKHVANKDELLDGMVDIVFGEIESPSIDDDWRSAMRRRAISARDALKRHSWAIGLMETRNPGPANLRNHNAVMGCLREAGFSFETAIHAYSVQDAYSSRRTPTYTASPSRRRHSGSKHPATPEKPHKEEHRRSARSTTTHTSPRSQPSSPRPDTTTPSSSPGGSTSSSTASTAAARPGRNPTVASSAAERTRNQSKRDRRHALAAPQAPLPRMGRTGDNPGRPGCWPWALAVSGGAARTEQRRQEERASRWLQAGAQEFANAHLSA